MDNGRGIQRDYRIEVLNFVGYDGMENTITRQEHEEFARRQDDENKRQNRRIDAIEKNVEQINALTVSVERMATNMEHMLEVMKQQGERLDKLEREPSETGRQVKMAIITSIISAVVGAVVGAVLVLL